MTSRTQPLPTYRRTRAVKKGRQLAFRWEERRDPEILVWIGKCRVMLLPWLHYLFPPYANHQDTRHHMRPDLNISFRNFDQRMAKLFNHGFVSREPLSMYPFPLYGLGNRGAEELSARGASFWGIERINIDYTSELRKVAQSTQIRHYLMNAGFRFAIEAGMKDQENLSLLFWHYDKQVKETVTFNDFESHKNTASSELSLPFEPDNTLGILNGTRIFNFVQESDRSTHSRQSFANKIKAFYWWWKQERYRAHGWDGCRMLTTTLSAQRRDNLHTATRQIVQAIHFGKKIPPIFLFATEQDYLGKILNPPAIYDAIWYSAAEDNTHRLLQ